MTQVVAIYYNEDGDRPHIEQMEWETLRARLREHYYGQRVAFAKPGEKFDAEFFVGLVVIEGKIVAPTAIQVATDFELGNYD